MRVQLRTGKPTVHLTLVQFRALHVRAGLRVSDSPEATSATHSYKSFADKDAVRAAAEQATANADVLTLVNEVFADAGTAVTTQYMDSLPDFPLGEERRNQLKTWMRAHSVGAPRSDLHQLDKVATIAAARQVPGGKQKLAQLYQAVLRDDFTSWFKPQN